MNYLALDVETGGLDSDTSLLTAYFGVFSKDGDEFMQIDELNLALRPDNGIYNVNPEALAINKIDLIELNKEAIYYKEAKSVLYSFLKENFKEERLVPIGHCVDFDILCVQRNLLSRGSWEQFVSYRALDTMAVARFLQFTGKLAIESLSLSSLIDFFDIKVEGKLHNAKYDTLCTVKVLENLAKLV